MTPDEEDVRTLTADACQMVLGLEVLPTPAAPNASGAEVMLGRVVVTGAWHGAVTITCSTAFAQQAAERIFEGQGDASPDDVRDALGELTNIIGGGVKGLMPSPSRLSLPVVSGAAGWHGAEAGGPANGVWFECSGERLVVTVTAGGEPPTPPVEVQRP